MADFTKKNVANGIDIIFVPATQFKTNELAVSLLVPLKKETASENALLSLLLCESCSAYKTLRELNTHLASLYGAVLSPAVSKLGENQVIKFGITCIDDRFALDDKKILTECLSLLLSLLFEPNFDENGLFTQNSVDVQKRLLIEKIESEENEKRTYVLRKTESIMFEGEPYAINRYGTKDDVNKATLESLKTAWENLLKTSSVLLTVVGNASQQEVKKLLLDKFSNVERDYKAPVDAVFNPVPNEIKKVKEEMEVKQGKLVMGFRVNIKPDSELAPAMRSFADVFGGGPYSKLFANVREKMSLCYYCSARYVRQKSFIVVQSGCEEENMDKAVSEILNQIEEIKKGNFDYEFSSSKMALTDAINSVYDAPESLEVWYTSQMADKNIKSPAESAAENKSVTKEQIMECANLISLDTVYRLVGNDDKEEN